MSVGSLSLRQIDEICTRFEKDWSSGRGVDELWKFVQQQTPEMEPSMDLYVELVQIDLEHRWRNLVKSLDEENGQEIIEDENFSLPSISDYLNEPGRMGSLSQDLWKSLSICDLKCRLRFGDVPEFSKYDLPESWMEKYHGLLPEVSVRHHSIRKNYQCRYWSPLLIGRQGIDEPDPIAVVSTPRQKLIVTDLRDTTISRQQAEVRVVAGSFARVRNNSRNRYFAVEQYGIVGPESELLVRLPFIVSLGTISIEFKRR